MLSTRVIALIAPLALVVACDPAKDEPTAEGAGAAEDRARDPDSEGSVIDDVDSEGGVTTAQVADNAPSYIEVEASLEVVASATIGADGGLSGDLRYLRRWGDSTPCDLDVAFTGAPMAGDCAGCDFAFDVAAAVSADRGEGACPAPTLYTLLDNPSYGTHDPVLGFWSTMTTPSYTWDDGYGGTYTWGGATYHDVFQVGYSWTTPAYDGPYGYWAGGTYGPSWSTWSMDEWASPYASARVDGDTLSWDLTQSYLTYEAAYGATACETFTWEEATAVTPRVADQSVRGTLGCVGYEAYGWDTGGMTPEGTTYYQLDGSYDAHRFTAAAGEEIQVTVDTVAADTAFDPLVYLLSPSECTLAYQDSGADCSFAPSWGQCPSFKFEAAEAGDHTVVVTGWGSCVGEVAEYQLDVVRL